MKRSKLALCASAALVGVAALSSIHPWGNLRAQPSKNASILTASTAPDRVRNLLDAKCGNCHSNNTRWPVYSRVAPTSWLVERDVHDGREHFNLSIWDRYSIDSRMDLLSKIGVEIRRGEMPPERYLLLHPQARLSDSERKLISDWAKTERTRLKQTKQQASGE